MNTTFDLERDAHGRLVLTGADGTVHVGVLPVRAFPLAAPDHGLSLIGTDGRECAWVERLDTLPPAQRSLILEELAAREFSPEITRLRSVSTFSTPSTWEVDTARGATRLVLKGEEDIRRLPSGALLITDSHGISYRVNDPGQLDRRSRRMLDRFL